MKRQVCSQHSAEPFPHCVGFHECEGPGKEEEAAFPGCIHANPGEWAIGNLGLTKREWFAGMALSEIIRLMGAAKNEDIARQCFGLADAMIEASKK